ncbi:pyruvate formate-lyase-activating enzyme [Kitasatospora indigofera]|uniref:Pyruvate formate-lyase-activating enzyme n=1 Tax=Kitasatospora indigofera TaxID=67307 RepID=A0A919FBK5_9ACTN|nr:pyruvate formate-lyase-activating protein [Kitasatospora indigofera]GHH59609.1 pyruvate formate-lyase-activating enzyme [Kitasatospora indigofera]
MTVTLGTAVPVGPPPARTGSVHSWDVSTGVDGPGTRFVVFLAGCPLTCLYCHNPDTWRMLDGTRTGVDAVVAEATRHAAFIHAAGGGATLTGGEPLLQPAFCTALFERFKHQLGLHTALDTSGFLGARADDRLLADVDLVLLDIKSWDRDLYLRLTGQHLGPTLDFARRLADLGKEVWVRFVLVPGLTDGPANVEGVAQFAASLGNVSRVDVLPFHTLGAAKYRARGSRFPLEGTPSPSAEQLEAARSVFAGHGLLTV